ncbi:MAG TPA: DUF4133 domain-containing protein [Puia sp.]
MSHTVYPLNRGINKAIEFHGLKAQYIRYIAAAFAGLLLLSAGLYLAGFPPYPCMGLILLTGAGTFHRACKLSRSCGQYGVMKIRAAGRMPKVLVSRSRRVFMLS